MRSLLVALLLLPNVATAQNADAHGAFDDTFRKYSKRFFGPAFDWHYFKAQGLAESNLRPAARSHVGARGVMQVMPGTYAEIKKKNRELGKLDDPESNIAAGIMYDRKLWEAWDSIQEDRERRRFMFASYNAGPGNIRRASRAARAARLHPYIWASIERVAPRVNRWRSRETIGYVRKIELFHTQLGSTVALDRRYESKVTETRIKRHLRY
jgi:soluble lytic murein transglycosylase-like protein